MKKLITALLFVSGMFLFACDDPSEELFQEVDEQYIELEDIPASNNELVDSDIEA